MLNASELFVLSHESSPGWIYKYLPGEAALWDSIATAAHGLKGSLRIAGVGAGDAQRVESSYRGDSLRWMSEEYRAWRGRGDRSSPDGVHAAFDILAAVERQLGSHLAGRVRLDPARTSMQLAVYPGDGHASYMRHRDCVVAEQGQEGEQGGPHRVFTCILYANSASWQVERDGGALRIFSHPSGWSAGRYVHPAHAPVPGEEAADVSPAGGRLVLFRSSSVEHAVQASRQARAAWTMWLYGWEEGDKGLATAAAPRPHLTMGTTSATRPSTTGTPAAPTQDWAAVAGRIERGDGSAANVLQAFLQPSLPACSPSPPSPLPLPRLLAPASPPPAPPTPSPTIFLLVPAYRDPQAVHTVLDAIRAARHPSRVHAGIVWQWETEQVGEGGSDPYWWPGMPSARERDALGLAGLTAEEVALLSSGRVRHMSMDARCSSGPAWARACGSSLYAGEDWLLTVDAHSRGWVSGWDALLLAQAHVAGRHAGGGAGKPVLLSTYPQGYELQPPHAQPAGGASDGGKGRYEAVLPGPTDDRTLAAVPRLHRQQGVGEEDLVCLPLPAHLSPTVLCPGGYSAADGLLRLVGKRVQAVPASLVSAWQACVQEDEEGAEGVHAHLLSYPCIPCPYLAAGFLFCPAGFWMRTLLPLLAQLKGGFFGEEQCLAAAAVDAGAAIYAPALQVCYTLWQRAARTDHPPGWVGWREAAGQGASDGHAKGQALAWAAQEAHQFHAAVVRILGNSAAGGSLMQAQAGGTQESSRGVTLPPPPLPALAFASPSG